MKKSVAIGIGILVIVGALFLLTTTMSGNVIMGSSINNEDVENEYFRIDSGEVVELNEVNEDGSESRSG
ncbi:hypothetical protein HNV12_02170 [Methanococcoides sp. SA1]|nr:hypothetical protein [Methanococcoides sp. SA1]